MLPPGFRLVPYFLSAPEALELAGRVRALDYGAFVMHGIVARRRVRHFGHDYARDAGGVGDAEPPPAWLIDLRARVAPLTSSPPEAFSAMLINHYPPGAGVGWHRDAPPFGPEVIGVSLGSVGIMRFRRMGQTRTELTLALDPGSAYVIGGESRTLWHHTISPVKAERFSITFRTLRQRKS